MIVGENLQFCLAAEEFRLQLQSIDSNQVQLLSSEREKYYLLVTIKMSVLNVVIFSLLVAWNFAGRKNWVSSALRALCYKLWLVLALLIP